MMDYGFIVRSFPLFLDGFWLTIQIAVLAVAGALLGGGIVARCTMARPGSLHGAGVAFVEVMRNTPILVQIFILYFGLPSLGLQPSGFVSAVVALILQNSAYVGEIYRAAIRSVHPKQTECALALGMLPRTALLRIILPQALRRALPPLGNQLVFMIKDTSIASIIAVAELTHTSKLLLDQTAAPYEIFAIVALCYLALCSVTLAGVKMLELRFPVRA